ncbi:MAG: hypothetical protein ACREIR_25505, partial [Geminicoccaceae bacterium]
MAKGIGYLIQDCAIQDCAIRTGAPGGEPRVLYHTGRRLATLAQVVREWRKSLPAVQRLPTLGAPVRPAPGTDRKALWP